MTDSVLLKEWIKKSGLKMNYIAEQMGISRYSLSNKINNISPFNQYEIQSLCEVLNIKSLTDLNKIFFSKK